MSDTAPRPASPPLAIQGAQTSEILIALGWFVLIAGAMVAVAFWSTFGTIEIPADTTPFMAEYVEPQTVANPMARWVAGGIFFNSFVLSALCIGLGKTLANQVALGGR